MTNKEENQAGDQKAEKKIRNRTLVIEGTGYKTLLTNKFKDRKNGLHLMRIKLLQLFPAL
jgi:hypothetical protein